jgi:hypothetical protein
MTEVDQGTGEGVEEADLEIVKGGTKINSKAACQKGWRCNRSLMKSKHAEAIYANIYHLYTPVTKCGGILESPCLSICL